jgi:ribosomal protein S18 acetylase RimI-like enzyme
VPPTWSGDDARLLDLVTGSQGRMLALNGQGAAHRRLVHFGPVVCVDLGVPHPWGVQAVASGVPSRSEVASARAWLQQRGARHGWRFCVAQEEHAGSPWRDLPVRERMELFAVAARGMRRETSPPPSGLQLVTDPTYEQVVEGYGGWMSDEPLARRLVVPDDLERGDRGYVVGESEGRVVGCGFVWWSGPVACLSGIGVVADQRGRGVGRALTQVALDLAVTGPTAATVDVVWLHATADGARLYRHLGMQRLGTQVQVGPA